MGSIEICPHCGAEVHVHIHVTSAGIAVASGRCFHCERLVGRRLSPPAEERKAEEPKGRLTGWNVKYYDEDRGTRTRFYSLEEEELMHKHIVHSEEHLEYYAVEEVRV